MRIPVRLAACPSFPFRLTRVAGVPVKTSLCAFGNSSESWFHLEHRVSAKPFRYFFGV